MVGGAGTGGVEARHCSGEGVRRILGAEGREGEGGGRDFGGFWEGFGFKGGLREIDAPRAAAPARGPMIQVAWDGRLVGPSGGIHALSAHLAGFTCFSAHLAWPVGGSIRT